MANIIKRNDGYFIMVSGGYDSSGKQIRHTCTWKPEPGMTERQEKKALNAYVTQFEREVKQGRSTDATITFAAFSERFMSQYAEVQLAPKTVARYKQLFRRINPAIGHMKLEKIQVQHLADLHQQLQGSKDYHGAVYKASPEFFSHFKEKNLTRVGIAQESKIALNTVYKVFNNESITKASAEKIAKSVGLSFSKAFTKEIAGRSVLSNRTIRHHHMLVSAVLGKAVEWEIIKENKAKLIKPPKVTAKEIAYFDEAQVQALIHALSGAPEQEAVMIKLFLLTGMRRGELCGLEWKDIDFENRTLTIRRASQYIAGQGVFTKEPKTASSKRSMPLSKTTAELLFNYRVWQDKKMKAAGPYWQETDRLFTQGDGTAIHPDTVTGWFHKFLKRTGLPEVTVHGLRHTFVTLLIAKGVDIVTVSSLAGHANASTTLNMYSHAVQERKASAIEAVGDLLGGVV